LLISRVARFKRPTYSHLEVLPMKRLLVLSVASLLGTGCSSSSATCDAHTVRVTWNSFLRADNTAGSCSNASVNIADPLARYVDVYVDNTLVDSGLFPCTQGFVDIGGILTGSHDFRVEALDTNQVVISRDELTAGISDSCSGQQVDTQPSEGYVDLLYDFYHNGVLLNPDTCVASSQLWLSITDTINNTPAYSFTSPASAPACESSHRTLSLPLASGAYRFDWMEERVGTTLTSSDCSPQSFSVGRATIRDVNVALEDTGPACP
jgi:uncharacterized protein YcfL